MTRLIALVCGLAALCVGADAWATTLRVGKGGAYASVQAAVNALPAEGGTLELRRASIARSWRSPSRTSA